MEAAAILDFLKVGILGVGNVKKVNLHQNAKFRDYQSNGC